MSTDYQRGYNKGYSTGCRRSDAARDEQMELAKNAALRAERAEKEFGIGHCEDCANWARGFEPSNGKSYPNCAWGYCSVKRQAGSPWGTWVGEGTVGQTSPRFGCVLFKGRP